ncbi:hypothetical protein HK405_010967, partial [Cladochytrium tenue]
MPAPTLDPDAAPTPPRPSLLQRLAGARLAELDDLAFVTSVHLKPTQLLAFRATALAYMAAIVVVAVLANDDATVPKLAWPFYYTNLSWCGLLLYFLAATVATAQYVRGGSAALSALRRRPAVLRWLHWTLYTLSAANHIIVPVVFWAVLARSALSGPPPGFRVFSLVAQHATDLVLLVAEAALGRLPVFPSQWPPLLGVAVLYLCLSIAGRAWVTPYVDSAN